MANKQTFPLYRGKVIYLHVGSYRAIKFLEHGDKAFEQVLEIIQESR